ncbi:hypothetical protein [Streptomyces sp. NPDC019890]
MTSITHRTTALFRIEANKALDKAGTSPTHVQAPLSHEGPIPG